MGERNSIQGAKTPMNYSSTQNFLRRIFKVPNDFLISSMHFLAYLFEYFQFECYNLIEIIKNGYRSTVFEVFIFSLPERSAKFDNLNLIFWNLSCQRIGSPSPTYVCEIFFFTFNITISYLHNNHFAYKLYVIHFCYI